MTRTSRILLTTEWYKSQSHFGIPKQKLSAGIEVSNAVAMHRLIVFWLIVISAIELQAISIALKRQSLIYYEPPFENSFKLRENITEHYITQYVDHFNHQDNRTFQMVIIERT